MDLCFYSLKCMNYELESVYKQDQVKSVWVVDRTLSACKLTITVILVAAILLGLLPATPAALVAWLFYLSTLSMQQLLIQRYTEFYISHRLGLILVFKVLLAACLMGLVVTHTLEPAYSWGTFAKVLFMGGGVVMINCTGVLMPVLWRYHMFHSLVTLASFNALLLPSVIDTVLCTTASRRYLQLTHNAIESAAFQLGSTMVPVSVGDEALPQTMERLQAYTLVLWLQLYLGVLVPSMYLYMFEIRSRLQFLKHLPSPEPFNQTDSTTSNSSSTAYPSDAALQCPWFGHSNSPVVLPQNPLMLLHCFILLLGVALWNALHLVSGWLVGTFDHLGAAVWMQQYVAQHGAGNCIGLH